LLKEFCLFLSLKKPKAMKILYSLVLFCLLSNYGLAQTEFAPLGAKWYFSDGVLRTNSGFYSMFGDCTQCQITEQTNVNGDIVKRVCLRQKWLKQIRNILNKRLMDCCSRAMMG
jgi:hypothetical protein